MAISGDENWIAICPLDRLAHQTILCVRLGTVDVLLVRDGERVFACERACPHEQADLGLGRVADGRLFCPRHYASFDLHDGHISAGWPSPPLRRYAVLLKDGQILINAEGMVSVAK
jgi:3-phenylpropionate/trans-cinnamate dioxygenase ferredoxin subunit